MGSSSQKISNTAPIVSSLRIQTSTFGRAIARVYGRTRVSGNLIWYGDFTPIPHTTTEGSGGKGGGGVTTENTTYTYTTAVLIALCSGPIGGVVNVWRGKLQDSLANLGLSLFTGSFSQNPFGFLTTNHPDEALSYRGLAYVASGAYDLGDSASLPNHSFEIDGLLQFSGSIKDSNPKDVIVDVLTDPFEGALFPSAKIGDLTQLSNYCVANGIFISPAYTEQKPAHQVLESLAQIANAGIVFSEGMLKIRPYSDEAKTGNGATYTPDVTPVYALTDDDFLAGDDDPVQVERSDPADAFNQGTLKYVNRANEYNDESVEAKDQANIDLYGLRPMESAIEMREIADAAVARVVVQNIQQRALFVRNTYRFPLPWNFVLLEPMDIVTLTEASGDGLDNVPVRIVSVEENEDGALDIEAEDFPAGVSAAVAYPMQQGGGYAADYNVQPGNVNAPVIFDMPAVMADSGFELGIAVSGPDPNWGGCQVWVATDSGGPFKQVGSIFGPARHGTLTATLPAGADPDTVNTASVSLLVSNGTLDGGVQADADNLNTLSWIEGELISFQDATLTGANAYDLETYLRRGVFNTAIASHASAQRFVRIDQAVFRYPYDPELVGSTLYFKLVSFNPYQAALQDISALSAHSYAIAGPIGAPDAPTGFVVQQSGAFVNFSVDQLEYIKLDRVEIRYADPGETLWENGIPVTNILRGNTDTNGSVPPGAWRFQARSFDRAGNPSKTWAVYDMTVTAEGFQSIVEQREGDGWPGTLTNFVLHHTGVLVPKGQNAGSTYTGNEWIDQWVPDPYAICTYEAPEIDKGIEGMVRVWGDIVSALGPGVGSGVANPKFQIDHKAAAGSYDGFEDWVNGNIDFRYLKSKLIVDTAVGLVKVTQMRTVVDKQPIAEEKHDLVIGASGLAVIFDAVYHVTPNIQAFSDDAAPRLPTHTADGMTGTTLHLFNTSAAEVGGAGGYRASGV